jgi:PilZ domain
MFDKMAAEDDSWRSSISLEDGADEWPCNADQLDISERGICFNSRCRFPLGTQLSVTFSFIQSRADGVGRVCTEGIVVGCEELATCCYRMTLLFLEMPENLRRQLSIFAAERGIQLESRWSQTAG